MSGLIIVLIKLLNEFLADLEFDSHVCRYIHYFARVRVSSVSFWALVWFESSQTADCYFATCFDFIFMISMIPSMAWCAMEIGRCCETASS